jgi:hypothetical protein
MTPEQLNAFMLDYGPILWAVFLAFIVASILVKSWPFIKGVVKTVEIIEQLPGRLDRIEERINNVEKEVTTNSGSSLKDAIKRIELRTCGDCQLK